MIRSGLLFCCRDCGTLEYCHHKLNIANDIFNGDNSMGNSMADSTKHDMMNLHVEEQFKIFNAMVPVGQYHSSFLQVPRPPEAQQQLASSNVILDDNDNKNFGKLKFVNEQN